MRSLIALALLLTPAFAGAQEVSEDIEEQLAKHPQNVNLRLDRAEELLRLGRLDEALVDCEVAAAVAPRDPAIALMRGRIHLAMGEPGLAEVHFSKVLQLGPPSVEVYLLRAGVREETTRFDEALADYDAARSTAAKAAVEKPTYDQLLEMIEIEEGRARALTALGREKGARGAREHVAHLKSLTRVARDPTDT